MENFPFLFLVVLVLVESPVCICLQAFKYSFVKESTSNLENAEFDYIVVGGGASGCPLAATLSKNFKVLLLERGGSPYNDTNVERMDGFAVNLVNADNQTSPAERFVSEDGIPGHRGRVLGGGTSVNAGFYSRASDEDVEIAKWDRKLVEDSFQWVEDKVAFQPKPPTWQMALKSSLVESGVSPDNGFTYEHKHGTKVGGVIFDSDGVRHTSADLLEYADPNNIQVLLYATVTQVLFSSEYGRPQATGVIYLDKNEYLHKAFLKKNGEVILSAGPLGSPQLLMLSGIGPAKHLESMGIPLVVNLTGVGVGIADNPNNAIVSVQKEGAPYSLVQVVGITSFRSYIEELSGGAYAPSVFQALISLLRDPGKVVNLKLLRDSAEQFKEHYAQLVIIFQKIAGPYSKGKLKLASKNVKDSPRVKFNYYKDPRDLQSCMKGVRTIGKATEAPSFENLTYRKASGIPGSLGGLAKGVEGLILPQDTGNDTAVRQFCMDTMTTIWHVHGGCNIGPVVDFQYKVRGVEALRVVDISTFHSAPGTNPQATVMMLGRYMGVNITNTRLYG